MGHLMIVTVGDESTMEVDMDDVARFLTKLRQYPGDEVLTEIMEFFEDLQELMDAEAT